MVLVNRVVLRRFKRPLKRRFPKKSLAFMKAASGVSLAESASLAVSRCPSAGSRLETPSDGWPTSIASSDALNAPSVPEALSDALNVTSAPSDARFPCRKTLMERLIRIIFSGSKASKFLRFFEGQSNKSW